jgi:uncharacterized membrane protein HdeD (DUF308 family)
VIGTKSVPFGFDISGCFSNYHGSILLMNKPLAMVGGVVLVIGVVLIAVGAVGVLRGLTVVNTFSEPQSGEYV